MKTLILSCLLFLSFPALACTGTITATVCAQIDTGAYDCGDGNLYYEIRDNG